MCSGGNDAYSAYCWAMLLMKMVLHTLGGSFRPALRRCTLCALQSMRGCTCRHLLRQKTWSKQTCTRWWGLGNQGMLRYDMPAEQKALYGISDSSLPRLRRSEERRPLHRPGKDPAQALIGLELHYIDSMLGQGCSESVHPAHRPVTLGPNVAGKGPSKPTTEAAEMSMPCSTLHGSAGRRQTDHCPHEAGKLGGYSRPHLVAYKDSAGRSRVDDATYQPLHMCSSGRRSMHCSQHEQQHQTGLHCLHLRAC